MSLSNRLPVSVLLPTFNCASTVRETLESAKWAAEILVVDSHSTDGTLEVCCEYGARIVQHEYQNSAKQKNWAIPQCRHEWVLQVDSDEVVGPELRDEIVCLLQSDPCDHAAFRMGRRNYVLGRWVRYGGFYPDWQIRLMRRDRARWYEREVHAHVTVEGKVGTLRSDLLHYGMPTITRHLRHIDRYTRYEADEIAKSNRRASVLRMALAPAKDFLYRYLIQQGFRDGMRGYILCIHAACYSFMSEAKHWEIVSQGLERSPG